MGEYIQIGEVKTWYEQEGSGEPLVLLHGGMATNGLWAPQMPDFAARFRLVAPERRGHGHTPDVAGPLSYDVMAADTIGFLETVVGGPAHLVGFSDGGIVALVVAMMRPELVHKVVAISAHFDTSGIVPEATAMMASWTAASDEVAMLRVAYEAVSPDGPRHWPVVFAKFLEMAATQPTISIEELGAISAPTLVLAGDDDMIRLEHTAELSRAVPNSQLGLVPGTSHFLAMEKPDLVNRLVLDFLEQDPVATRMPFRRAPVGGS